MRFIVKTTTLPGWLDLLAPHSCRGCGRIGTPLCDRCKKYLTCEHEHFKDLSKTLREVPEDWPRTTIVGPRDGLIGTLIHDLKYDSVQALAAPLAEILDAIMPKDINAKAVIVPLPTIRRHVRQRGLDHTLMIARELMRLRGYRVERVLIREKNTVQVGSNAKERIKQAKTAYALAPNAKIDPHTPYLLLDDVWTTGATMKAAVALLQNTGAKKLEIAMLARS